MEERNGLNEQVRQLSSQAEDLSRQLDEEREAGRSQREELENLRAAAEEDASRARKELDKHRHLLQYINEMSSGPPTTQTQRTPAKKEKEIMVAGKENKGAAAKSSRRSTRSASQTQQDSQA